MVSCIAVIFISLTKSSFFEELIPETPFPPRRCFLKESSGRRRINPSFVIETITSSSAIRSVKSKSVETSPVIVISVFLFEGYLSLISINSFLTIPRIFLSLASIDFNSAISL